MAPVLGVLLVMLFVGNFGSYGVQVGRRALHKLERHVSSNSLAMLKFQDHIN